jgi:hypothetical protein
MKGCAISVKTASFKSCRDYMVTFANIESSVGLSVSRQIAKRLLLLYSFGRVRWETRTYLGHALKGMEDQRNSGLGREALIIAHGHSTSRLNVEGVARAVEQGLDVFAINNFYATELSSSISPTHLVLSDPFTGPSSHRAMAAKIWNELDQDPEVQLIAPHGWYPELNIRRTSTLYFNDCGLQGLTKNISPMRPKGYVSRTAFVALAVAIYMGYDRIFIIGFDNTMHRSFRVDEFGGAQLGDTSHFYGTYSESGDPWADGGNYRDMADFLFSDSLCLVDLDRCFSSSPVVNLDLESSTRAFKKIADPRLINEVPPAL